MLYHFLELSISNLWLWWQSCTSSNCVLPLF